MQQQLGAFTNGDGQSLFTRTWMPDGPARGTIIIAHGYGEHCGRYEHVAAYFTGQGYAVFTYDQRGHGKSVPAPAQLGYFERFAPLVNDLAAFVKHVQQQRPAGKPTFLIGHSMGGLLALTYLIAYPPPAHDLRGAVFSGTLLDVDTRTSAALGFMVRRVLGPLMPRAGLVPVDVNGLSHDPEVVRAYAADPLNYHGKVPARVGAEWFEACRLAKLRLPTLTLPILVLHGQDDPIAGADCARIIYEKAGGADKSIRIYEGFYHEIFNEVEQARVLADVRTWLMAHMT